MVLDSSALLAMLLGEPGGELVVPVLTAASMSTVSLAEIAGYYGRKGAPERETRITLAALPIAWVPLDDELAIKTGLLLPTTKSAGLSLGDRACLALAARLGVRAMTADRAWKPLGAQLGIDIELIRK